MTESPDQPSERKSRDEEYWAPPVSRLKTSDLPEGASRLNVDGRNVVGPLQGFGQMWQKTYKVRLSGTTATSSEVIKTWKENFQEFWPAGNRFHRPLTGIAPGEVAALDLSMPGGLRLSTGVLVIYSDDESFTFMTPQGHMLSGWITFSAYEEAGSTVAQTQVLIRANDPLYEIGFRLTGSGKEDRFWHHTLRSLAAHFGVNGQVQQHLTCVDPKVQWSQARNIWHNAAIRTALYTALAPLRWIQNAVLRH